MTTVFFGSSTALRRWWRMRPASHIPLAEIITIGIAISLSCFERAASRTYSSRSNPNGSGSVIEERLRGGVEAVGVAAEDLGGAHRQRAVHEHGDGRELARVPQRVQRVDELLRPPDGEGRDHDASRRARPSAGPRRRATWRACSGGSWVSPP
jgi:hypothetical protein